MKELTENQKKGLKYGSIGLGLIGLGVGIYFLVKKLTYKPPTDPEVKEIILADETLIKKDVGTMTKDEILKLQKDINILYAASPATFDATKFKHLPIVEDGIKGDDTTLGQIYLKKSYAGMALDSPATLGDKKDLNYAETVASMFGF